MNLTFQIYFLFLHKKHFEYKNIGINVKNIEYQLFRMFFVTHTCSVNEISLMVIKLLEYFTFLERSLLLL